MATWELNGVTFGSDAEAKNGFALYDSLVELHGREKANKVWPNVWATVKRERKKVRAMCKKYNCTVEIIKP